MTSKRYFIELIGNRNDGFQVVTAKRLMGINQYKNRWKRVVARNFARELNKAPLVIK